MRTVANRAEIADLEGHWSFTYLEVTADDGSWLNLGALTVGAEDLDFFNTFQIAESIDSNTLNFSASLKRDIGPYSLSPFRTDSPINMSQVSPGLYAPALDLNRLWRVMIAVVARGTTPVMPDDYIELNSGVIERLVIHGLADTVEVAGMGMESPLLKAFVLKDRTYSGDLEDVIQAALDDQFGTGVIPLLGYPTGEYVDDTIGDINLMPALSDMAAIKGDTLRYRYDASHVNQFTLFTPPRGGGTPDWSTDGLEYEDLDVEIDLSGVRNLIPVTYYDAASALVATVVAPGAEVGTLASVAGVGTFSTSQAGIVAVGARLVIDRTGSGDFVAYEVLTFDGTTGVTLRGTPTFTAREFYTSASITRYGLQVFAMDLSADTQVTTQAGAQGLADFVLSDREDPAMVQRLRVPGLWFVQLHDIVGTAANGVIYDEDQSGGVTAYTLSGANGMLDATIDLAGYPKGRYTTWKQIGSGAPASRVSPAILNLTATHRFNEAFVLNEIFAIGTATPSTDSVLVEYSKDPSFSPLHASDVSFRLSNNEVYSAINIADADLDTVFYVRMTPYSGPMDTTDPLNPLPTGTPGDPIVANTTADPTIKDSATVTVDRSVPGEVTLHVSAGGVTGTAAYATWDPDAPFASPSAYDDEFDSATIDPKWTQVNGGSLTTLDTTSIPSQLYLTKTSNNSTVFGLMQPILAGDWSITAKVSHTLDQTDFVTLGIWLSDGVTAGAGNQYRCALAYVSGWKIVVVRDTNWNTFNSTIGTLTPMTVPKYLRVSRNGTSLFLDYSNDGIIYTGRITWTSAFTLTHFGLGYHHQRASVFDEAAVDFFRVYPGAALVRAGALRIVVTG